MAVRSRAVHETVDVVGRASSAILPAVLSALAGDATLQVLQVAPGSIQCVHNRRPTWATVAGVIGLLVCGLGVLFFFVRRTDICTVTVVDGPRGAVVTLSGTLDEAALDRIRGALDSSGVAGAASPSPITDPVVSLPLASAQAHGLAHTIATAWVAPPIAAVPGPVTVPDAERTMARTLLPSQASGVRVRFDHGPVADVLAPVLVGRDPSVTVESLRGAILLAVPDPTLSVSKTHLVLRAHEGRLWVDDLHSTNGTAVVHPNGERIAAAPGSPVAVPPGAIVEFGDRRLEVLPA